MSGLSSLLKILHACQSKWLKPLSTRTKSHPWHSHTWQLFKRLGTCCTAHKSNGIIIHSMISLVCFSKPDGNDSKLPPKTQLLTLYFTPRCFDPLQLFSVSACMTRKEQSDSVVDSHGNKQQAVIHPRQNNAQQSQDISVIAIRFNSKMLSMCKVFKIHIPVC